MANMAAEIMQLGYKTEDIVGHTKIDPLSKVRRILAKSGYEISDSGELMRKVIQKIGKRLFLFIVHEVRT